MTLDPASWPILLVIVAAALTVVVLIPRNVVALRAVTRPASPAFRTPGSGRARVAWLVSFAALFTGPLAPLSALFAVLLGLRARRALLAEGSPDPLDVEAADVAVLNGGALLAVSTLIMAGVWWVSG